MDSLRWTLESLTLIKEVLEAKRTMLKVSAKGNKPNAQKKFNLENQRPKIQLRNRGKIKFKVPYTTLTKVQNSPFYRGAKLWERLPEGVQIATTKVKFKTMIR